jgi:uncharacterized protein (TIGR02271 family)
MMTNQRSTVIGVFADREHAQAAVNELRRLGFREDQIGVAARDGERMEGTSNVGDTASKAGTGAATGLAAGAGVGALWGIGIAAGLLPAIGPAIAGGTLATILSSAAAGAAAAGIAGALIGLGIPEDEAEYYEGEFHAGRTIVTVKADSRFDEAHAVLRRHGAHDMSTRDMGAREAPAATAHRATSTGAMAHGATCATGTPTGSQASGDRTIQVREEEMRVQKQPVQAGEVSIRKEVHTEHKTVEVPVRKEEVVIERRPVAGHKAATSGIGGGETIRVPVQEEQVHVEKRPVVKEEVHVGKHVVQDTEQVSGTVKKEEVKIEKKGDADIRHGKRS